MILASCLFVSFAAALYGAWSDFKSLRIPNVIPLTIFLFFIVGFLYVPESFGSWRVHGGAGLLMFLISYVMFITGVMGGGDSKLMSSIGFWIGLKNIAAFVFVMAVIGGVLGVLSLIIKKKKPFGNPAPESWIGTVQSGGNAIPYGIAIAIGFLVTVALNGFLQK